MTFASVMPPEWVLKAILKQGGAFKASHEFRDEGQKERYFFVANRSPASDELIVLLTPTTQIDKRRRHHRERADLVLVAVGPSDYVDIARPSVIDCESPIRWPRATFEAQALAGKYKPLPALPTAIFVRILAAISESRTLSLMEKRLILEPDTA